VERSSFLGFRGHRAGDALCAHDQLGATCAVLIQVHGDQPIDHLTLALPHVSHVDHRSTFDYPERRRVVDEIGHFGTPDRLPSQHD